MPEDQFSLFPNWDNPEYRRYWLKHNLAQDVWQEWSGADIWRALASQNMYVSRNMLYEVRREIFNQPWRENEFYNLDPEEGIPQGMFEHEPYWKMSADYMYVLHMTSMDEEGNTVLTSRAISTDERLTPAQIEERAHEIFNRQGYEGYIGFDKVYIAHAYRR